MANSPFSSLTRRERFWANTAVVLILAVLLAFAIYAWTLFQARLQEEKISNQEGHPAAAAPVVGSSVAPAIEGDNSATNEVLTTPPPFVPPTNSN
jgi:hypothetical protein